MIRKSVLNPAYVTLISSIFEKKTSFNKAQHMYVFLPLISLIFLSLKNFSVRLTGPGFRGFLMQVRKVRENGRIDDVNRLGRFLPDEVTWDEQGIKLLSCSPVEKYDSITHSRNHRRNFIEVEWRPERNEGTVQIM